MIPSRVCTDKRDHAPTFMRTVSVNFAYLAFDAAGAAGTSPGGLSGEQTFFAVISTVLYLCAPPA